MSDKEPPVSRWLVRKADGTELRFPSLEALKPYILSGVVTSGDVVAPEDASWARVEDLAELASLMGMIAPAPAALQELKRPATRPNLNFGNALDALGKEEESLQEEADEQEQALLSKAPTTKPPPLPQDERTTPPEPEEEPKTVYSGPPSFDDELRGGDKARELKRTQDWGSYEAPSSGPAIDIDPLSRPLRDTNTEGSASPSPLDQEDEADLLSRPISTTHGGPPTHEVMSLNLKRAQRRRVILGSILIGMLVAIAIFFAIQNLQEASTPPAEATKEEEVQTKEPTKTPSGAEENKAERAPEGDKTKPESEGNESPEPNKAASEKKEVPPSSPDKEARTKAETKEASVATSADKGNSEKKPKPQATKQEALPKQKIPSSKGAKAPSDKGVQANPPKNVDGLLSRAKKVRKKSPSEALKLYKEVLQKSPNHADAMQLAARAYMQLGQYSKAVDLLQTCRQKRPRFSPCIFYLGRAFEGKGDRANARKAYKKLIDESPESSLATKARKRLGN